MNAWKHCNFQVVLVSVLEAAEFGVTVLADQVMHYLTYWLESVSHAMTEVVLCKHLK